MASTNNQKAGSQLATWYNDDRILDGDAFYVNAKRPPARAGRPARPARLLTATAGSQSVRITGRPPVPPARPLPVGPPRHAPDRVRAR
nr:hypothetical protein HEP87_00075 [Streptomyces sp. S1D4-11]